MKKRPVKLSVDLKLSQQWVDNFTEKVLLESLRSALHRKKVE